MNASKRVDEFAFAEKQAINLRGGMSVLTIQTGTKNILVRRVFKTQAIGLDKVIVFHKRGRPSGEVLPSLIVDQTQLVKVYEPPSKTPFTLA